ncbi:MAG TPA: ATP-binding protein, partial [Leptospiraceae bacterium]|nr:ATP-binding protein [Leptospiraceae bacterium]
MIENDALKIENCLNDAPCGYLRLDSNGRIFFANNTLLKWLNFELDNLTNKVWTFLLSGGSRIYEQTHFTPLLRMQGYVEEINLDLIDSKGDKIPFLINAKILVEDSTVDIFLFRFNQRKSYEKEILIAKKNAELSAKVKSEFLSNMSHEIRTPLNGIIGFSELLLSSKLDSSQEEYIRIINQAGNSLLELINDILDLSKLEAEKVELHIEKTNVYQLLEHCIDLIKFKANEKEIELLLYISPNVPEYIFTDPIRLRQVIINLLGNAVKFTEKGEIELRVEGNITNLNSNQIEISFTIRDTGIGISNEKQRVIFDAFSQADSSISQKYGGTGLGLTISNKLLKLFNSKLNVNSQP